MKHSIIYKAVTEVEALGFHTFFHDEGEFIKVSAENGDDAADYYGEFHNTDGLPWINPELEAIATKYGMFWEWCNPGCIALYEA